VERKSPGARGRYGSAGGASGWGTLGGPTVVAPASPLPVTWLIWIKGPAEAGQLNVADLRFFLTFARATPCQTTEDDGLPCGGKAPAEDKWYSTGC
jgi:hypothetical protein